MAESPVLECLAFFIIIVGIVFAALITFVGLRVFHIDQTTRLLKQSIDKTEADKDCIFTPPFINFLTDTRKDELERRNDFWLCSHESVVVTLIVTVLTALLFTNKISPEAGLPIISGLSGFAIAKTANSGRNKHERER